MTMQLQRPSHENRICDPARQPNHAVDQTRADPQVYAAKIYKQLQSLRVPHSCIYNKVGCCLAPSQREWLSQQTESRNESGSSQCASPILRHGHVQLHGSQPEHSRPCIAHVPADARYLCRAISIERESVPFADPDRPLGKQAWNWGKVAGTASRGMARRSETGRLHLIRAASGLAAQMARTVRRVI